MRILVDNMRSVVACQFKQEFKDIKRLGYKLASTYKKNIAGDIECNKIKSMKETIFNRKELKIHGMSYFYF